MKCYVLCLIESGEERAVAEELKKFNDIESISVTFGEYDLVITVNVKDIKTLDKIVTRLRKIKGIKFTSTLIGE